MRVNHERADSGGLGWFSCHGPQAEESRHRSSEGVVRYLRCTCGAWLVVLGEPGAGECVAQLKGNLADHPWNRKPT